MIIIGIAGILVIAAVGMYMYYMPHRDVQSENAAFTLDAGQLVNEFTNGPAESNAKYLDQVIIVSGTVAEITEDALLQKVVLLKADNSGVSCTFMKETNENAVKLKPGDQVKIKGIVRLGASYDEDLDLAEYAILEKCDIVN